MALLYGLTLLFVALWGSWYAYHHQGASLQSAALEDALTGALNRRALEHLVEKMIARSQRQGKKFALLFVDMDNFKTINDTMGHHVGDMVLVESARRFHEALRENDAIGRIGGDEFVLLLDDIRDTISVVTTVERLIKAFDIPIQTDRDAVRVHFSIGISLYPDNGQDRETLFRSADIAMYHVKERGKGTYSFFNSELNRENIEFMAKERALRHALVAGQFELCYQNQLSLGSESIREAEALIRWNRPGTGIVMPSEFLPHAERSGLIHDIGAWVIGEACRQIRLFSDAGVPTIISINVSPLQLRDRRILTHLEKSLKRFEIDPSMLELEIAESALLEDEAALIPQLHALKRLGVRLAVDGFGRAYSSMGYMKRLPLDRMKIDRSLMNEVLINPKNRELVSAMVALGHVLNMSVVTEGIEVEGLLEESRRLHADAAQGYFVSQPKKAKELLQEFLVRESMVS